MYGNRGRTDGDAGRPMDSDVDSTWNGPWRAARPDEAPAEGILWETDSNEVFYDHVRLEGEELLRESYLVWDGLSLTRILGRYRRG